jgi:D-alanine-D-alanine ligase
MEVLIVHDAVPADAPPESQDTLTQVRAVAEAVAGLGHAVRVQPLQTDLAELQALISPHRPDVVFNLVERLGGTDALALVVPAWLAANAVPHTGCDAAASMLTADKVAAKKHFRRLGIPTPDWFPAGDDSRFVPGRWILKARYEHASVGMGQGVVQRLDDPDIATRSVAEHSQQIAHPCFAERFIDGREFNISLMGEGAGPLVLPLAEIDFSAFPEHCPRIVDYRAKWLADSFEYQNTPRRFDFAAGDGALLSRLEALARHCWRAFGLTGYARVDVRVDADGPWVLEVNTNPCLAPDAGFVAAAQRAGMDFTTLIQRILHNALSTEG